MSDYELSDTELEGVVAGLSKKKAPATAANPPGPKLPAATGVPVASGTCM